MGRRRIIMTLAGVAAVWCAAPLTVTHAAETAARGGAWGKAIEVRGLGSGASAVVSVSCASAGNCAAGGFHHAQAFVVSERNGRWARAQEVPGLGKLSAGGLTEVDSVSCGSAGNCAAAGFYVDGSKTQAFVASERNGRWGTAIEVPGSATLNAGGVAKVNSVSCASKGNCAAGGYYTDHAGGIQAFVVSERSGRWAKAQEVPGSGALNLRGDAEVTSVSCGSAGNCAAAGFYAASFGTQAFVASERNGRWAKAQEVPGSAALNLRGDAEVNSVSCTSAGNCSAGGFYTDGTVHVQALVVSERDGRWGKAIEVPGSATLNGTGFAHVNSVSCASAGNCAAAGFYIGDRGDTQAFVVSQRNGHWGKAIEMTGSATLNAGGDAQANSVSCSSAGNCSAGGIYSDSALHLQAFVVSQQNSHWGKAIEVPGTATLNEGLFAMVNSVSCSPAGPCAAGGFYRGANETAGTLAFVVNRS